MPVVNKLLKHQEKFITFTQTKCYNAEGFLLFHYMGTGKTITALSWTMNYPHKDIVIICPLGLENVWISEREKLGIAHRNMTIITWNDYFKNYKMKSKKLVDKLLILEESHSICKYFHEIDNINLKDDIMSSFNSAYKILSLSGTPIVNSILDICTLVNIALKKEALSLDKDTFYSSYGNLKIEDAKKTKSRLIKYNSIYYILYSMVRLFVPSKIMYLVFYSTLKYILSMGLSLFTSLNIVLSIGFFITYYPLFLQFIEAHQINEINEMIGKDDYSVSMYYDIDYDKLANKISSYIDYYMPEMKKSENSKYPDKLYEIQYFTYNLEQSSIMLEMIVGNLTDISIYMLQLTNSDNCSLFKNVGYNNLKEFLLIGRYVSNVSKFNKILHDLNIGIKKDPINGFTPIGDLSIILNMDTLDILPQKFKFIINNIIDNPDDKCLIYSNFYDQGYKIISLVLNILGLDHYILDVDQSVETRVKIVSNFNQTDEKIKIILFHPDIYEGISLTNTRRLFILEPIEQYVVREQLIARCVRYESHKKLPKKDRNVIIYNFIYKQVGLIHGERIVFIDELKKLHLSNPNIPIIDYNITNNESEPIGGEDEEFTTLEKLNMALGSIITSLSNFGTEHHGHLYVLNNIMSGGKKILNKKILEHANKLLHSKEGQEQIYDVYNFMYGPVKHRRKFLVNPDEQSMLKCETCGYNIQSIFMALKQREKQVSDECLQRDCEIWLPDDEGDCYILNEENES